MNPIWKIETGDGPIVAAAIHDGHAARDEVAALFALDDAGRLREEDPFTGGWARVGDSCIVGLHSRFEVDLNRPRDKAVYRVPDDAWGLQVWHGELPEDVYTRSLASYDAFYATVKTAFDALIAQHGKIVVLDLHTYNHRRDGTDAPPADPLGNPEVNLGTGSVNKALWGSLVARFMSDLGAFDYNGRQLDVRENVKFQGGNFSRWIHQTYPDTACSIAIEFKKFFMDEWSGQPDPAQVSLIHDALTSTVAGLRMELAK